LLGKANSFDGEPGIALVDGKVEQNLALLASQ
jgi:hypothetical protein